MSIIRQSAMDVTSSMDALSLAYALAYHMRYELVFLIGLCLLWFTTLIGRSTTSKAPRKSLLPLGKLAHAEKRGRAEKQESLEVSLEGGTRSSLSQRDFIKLVQCVPGDSQLTNARWLIPRLTALCQNHTQRALVLLKAALDAGLKPQEAPADCELLYVSLMTSLIRMGLLQDAQSLLHHFKCFNIALSPSTCASTIRLCTSKHYFQECLNIYDLVKVNLDLTLVDKSVWSCLLFCAVEAHAHDRCIDLFALLKSCGKPSSKDYWNMIRFSSVNSDWKMMLELIQEMLESGVDVDNVIYNTALATCVSANQITQARYLLDKMEKTGGITDAITYNTIMKGYATHGDIDECFRLYDFMQQRGLQPSQITYGILLEGCNTSNKVDLAANIFDAMATQGCPMNTVLYTTLIKGFAREGKVDCAMRIYQQMVEDKNVKPDLITYSILLKANCDAGRMEKSLELVDTMLKSGLRPDEVIFNNLLAGCVKDANARLAKRLYSDMFESGVKPSNATFSILIRVYSQCKLLEDAVDMLRHEPPKHNVGIEARLYTQLIQCCIRARQGRRAIEVYEMMLAHSLPTASCYNNMLTMCVKLNMLDTAADILKVAAAKGSHVDSRDANMVLSAAVRKNKVACVEAIRTSMLTLGAAVDRLV